MRKVFSFVKSKKEDKSKVAPQISVEITNPSGERITSDDEQLVGLQPGHGYDVDLSAKSLPKLHKAAWLGNLDKVKAATKKTDVNAVDGSSRTALHLAAAAGHTDVVWFLVNNNASLETLDADGYTPFLKAVECGTKDCCTVLIDSGSNINALDIAGNNALHIAAARGYSNIATVLLKEGVSYSTPNNNGDYALHMACSRDHREIVEAILRVSGSVVNEPRDKDRRTPLMLSARAGHLPLVKFLLEHGATINAKDSNGWSAEDYAHFGGHQELQELLKAQSNKASNIPDSSTPDSINQDSKTSDAGTEKTVGGEGSGGTEEESSLTTIPPPLEPPKSWDLIKSGAIQGSEVSSADRPNLLPLSTDHDGNPTATTPDLSPTNPLAASDEMRLSPIPSVGGASESGRLTPERRSRSPLERAHSLDLPSENDSPTAQKPSDNSPKELPHDKDMNVMTDALENTLVNNNQLNSECLDNANLNDNDDLTTATEKTVISRKGTKESEDSKSFDSNENTSVGGACGMVNGNASSVDSPMDCSFEALDGKSCSTTPASFDAGTPGSFDAATPASFDTGYDDPRERSLSIEIIQSTGKLDDTLEVTTIKGVFKESHSLDLLDGTSDMISGTGSGGRSSAKRHVRNRSITLTTQPQYWKSVDMIYSGGGSGGINKPSDIDSQLECYDEALRQLAKVNKPPPVPQNTQVETRDVAISGPSSLEADGFPPPPLFFEGDHNLSSSGTGEGMGVSSCQTMDDDIDDTVPVPFPISMLTPIKETYLEQDSLSERYHSSDPGTSSRSPPPPDDIEPLPPDPEPVSLDRVVQCHLDGGDLFLTDRDLSQYYPNFVQLKNLTDQQQQRSPARLTRSENICCSSMDSITPRFDIGGACSVRPPKRGKDSGTSPSEDSEEDSKEDPPFWIGDGPRGGTGSFMRQNTVVSVDSGSTPTSAHLKFDYGAGPSSSRLDPDTVFVPGTVRCGESPRSEAETASASDTPKHPIFLSKLMEGGCVPVEERLEEILGGDRQHDPVKQAQTIALLRNELAKIETKYTQAQEELVSYRQRAISAERDLHHMKNIHAKFAKVLVYQKAGCIGKVDDSVKHETEPNATEPLTEEKAKLYQELTKHLKGINSERIEFTDSDLKTQLKILEEENLYEREKNKKLENYLEEVLSANRCMMAERESLITQNITDVKKLQEDTLCWKERVIKTPSNVPLWPNIITRYEECAAKLELMERNQDPRLVEAQDTIETLKRTISILQQEKSVNTKLSDACTSMGGLNNSSAIGDAAEHIASGISVGTCSEDKPKSSVPHSHSESELQIAELERRLKAESSKRLNLETQVSKLQTELQDRYKWEEELVRVHERLERDFVSKGEFERMRWRQEEAMGRVKQEAVRESEVKVSAKIAEINRALQTQMNEQARLDRERTKSEATLKKEVEATRHSLLVELGKLQAELKAKEFEEDLIRLKCEKLTREIEKIQDTRQRNLIDKSLSINLADLSPSRITTEAESTYLQASYESRGKTLPSKEHRCLFRVGLFNKNRFPF